MHRAAHALLLPLVLAGSAAYAEPTVLVIPFDGAMSDFATAAQLRIIGTLHAYGGVNLIHPKMYNRVYEHHAHKLTKLDVAEQRQRFATSLGANWIISGFSTVTTDNTIFKIDVVSVGKKTSASIEVKGDDLISALEALPLPLVKMLRGTKTITEDGEPLTPDRVMPVTKNEQAMLQYAACYRVLIQQPIGVRQPVVVASSVLAEAISLCESAKQLDPEMPDARAALGLAYGLLGERRRAELHLASVKDSQVFLPLYHVGKFWVLSRYYDTEAALAILDGVIQKHGGFLLVRGYLGDAYSALGRHDDAMKVFTDYPVDAISILRDVIERGGARGEVHLRLGYALMLTGDLPGAEREFQYAIKNSKNFSEWRTRGRARYDLAKLWMKQGNSDNALRKLRMAVKEGFKDPRKLASDDDFKSLAKDKRFKKLMKTRLGKGRPNYVSAFAVDPNSGQLAAKPGRKSKKRINF